MMIFQTVTGIFPRTRRPLAALPLALAASFAPAIGTTSAAAAILTLDRIAQMPGAEATTHAFAPPGDPTRLFLLSLGSRQIRIYDRSTGTINATPYLPGISFDAVSAQPQIGSAFSMAFHPDFASNGKFYVSVGGNRTGADPKRLVVFEYTAASANAATVDPATQRTILTLDYPPGGGGSAGGHVGGAIAFGPDGYLYVTTGDGDLPFGPSNPNPAQDPSNAFGGILRIDPAGDAFPGDARNNYGIPPGNPDFGPGSNPALVAIGARNPFRMTLDEPTGRFFFGDVGEDAREEINILAAEDTYTAPLNYGWDAFEGTLEQFANSIDHTPPVYEYGHGGGAFDGISVTGGLVYRGPLGALNGRYFFGDFDGSEPEAKVWSLTVDQALDVSGLLRWQFGYAQPGANLDQVLGFGSDGSGNMYLLDFDGDLFAVTGAAVPLPAGAAALAAALGLLGVMRRSRRHDAKPALGR